MSTVYSTGLVGTITVSTDEFDNSGLTNATIASYLRTLAVINFYEKNYSTSCLICSGFGYGSLFSS
jgi:hypothetical protein